MASKQIGTYIQRLTPTGLRNVNYSAENLKAAALHEPRDGIYTVTNTYHGGTKVLMLDAHLNRLEESAQLEGIPLALDRSRLRGSLRQMIANVQTQHKDTFRDVRFRVTVPRETPQECILSLEPFHPPSEHLIKNGARCITTKTSSAGGTQTNGDVKSSVQRHNPASKTMDWIYDRQVLEKSMPPGIYDTFLLDPHGRILEGLASNFYALLHNPTKNTDMLYTAPDGQVLAGISRKIVFQVCQEVGLEVCQEAVPVEDIGRMKEAFLTSSSRGIIPVTEIDGGAIGDGIVGDVTKKLRKKYELWMKDHLEDL